MKLGLDADQIIEISVRNKESGDVTCGTGYPVTPGRVITAAHVLFDETTGDPLYHDCEISLRFHGAQYSELEPVLAVPVWNGFNESDGGGEDVAVLSCEFPRGIACHHSLPEKHVADEGTWHSRGFSEASEKVGQPSFVRGDFPVGSSGDHSLELEASKEFHDWRKWHGISGGPVFLTDRGCEKRGLPIFAGIITEYNDGQSPDSFIAVPMWKLLEHKSFKEAIAYDRFLTACEELDDPIEELTQLLTRLDGESKALKFFRDSWGDSASLPEEPRDCAKVLMGLPALKLPELLQTVFKRFADTRPESEVKIVSDIQDCLLPLRCFPDLRDQLRERLAPGRGVLVEGLIGHMSIMELLMAGVDGRRAEFEIRDVDEGPIGKDAFLVPDDSLPGGAVEMSLQAAIDLLEHLIDSMTDSLRVVISVKKLNRAKRKTFPETEPGKPDYRSRLAHLAEVFDSELQVVSEHNGGRKYYAIFEYPYGADDDDAAKRQTLRSAIEAIIEQMRHLTFLELVEEPDEREEVFERCIRFRHADRRD